jgi:hypothetical protein
MNHMKVIAVTVCLFASFAVVGTVSAQDHAARAMVPFGFSVGDQWVPAGTYIITSDIESPNIISLRSKDSKVILMSLTRPDDERSNAHKLVFTKYGDQYFLHEILCSSCGMNVAFPGSKHEKVAREHLRADGFSNASEVYLALK